MWWVGRARRPGQGVVVAPSDSDLLPLFPFLQVRDLAQGASPEYFPAKAVLLLEDVHGAVGELCRPGLGDYYHAVVVSHRPVAGVYAHARDLYGDVYLPETLGLARGGHDELRVDGEAQLADIGSVAHRGRAQGFRGDKRPHKDRG